MSGLPMASQGLGCQAGETALALQCPAFPELGPYGVSPGKLHPFFSGWSFSGCPVHPLPWLASPDLDRPMSARLEKIYPLFQSWPPQGLPVSGVQDRKDFLPLTQLVFWGVPDFGVSN